MKVINKFKKLKLYQIKTSQKLPITIEKAWNFLSNPKNLTEITPAYMNFRILSGADKKIFPGQIIQYKVSPILGLNLKWVTEITHVVDKEYFVDEQRFGPYSLWHHKHFIKKINGGIEMVDIVDISDSKSVAVSLSLVSSTSNKTFAKIGNVCLFSTTPNVVLSAFTTSSLVI